MKTEKNLNDYVVVVGGVNVDICGKSDAALIARDSNPGTVGISLGGVGKNIAHNLALLGLNVKMLTAIGDDEYAKRVRSECAEVGIDLSHARQVPGGNTSIYLAITGPEGDMALAVCDVALAAEITPAYLENELELLNGAAAVVVETNLTPEAIAFLAEHCTAPMFADPVSVTKAEKLAGKLGKLHTLKPNRIEAQLLSGVEITDVQTLSQAADALLDTGLQRVFISLGADGLYCADSAERIQLPCFATNLKNATGGGDALMAALVYCFVQGFSVYQTARFALAASSIAVEDEHTINPALNSDAVLERAQIKFMEEVQ